jgi:exodeoxyribonuclease V beta subunit
MTNFCQTAPLRRGITLLEASAGTGKTYSIANLFLRLVVDGGLDVASILVVTFTRAATAELADRVFARLAEAHDAVEDALAGVDPPPDDEVIAHLVAEGRAAGTLERTAQRLHAARESFDQAAISTIHGFCQRMLQRNAFESGAALDADLLEDPTELLGDLVDDYLSPLLAMCPVEWVSFVRSHGGSRADLLDIAAKIEAEPDIVVIPDLLPDSVAGLASTWSAALAGCRAAWADEAAFGDLELRLKRLAPKKRWSQSAGRSAKGGGLLEWLASPAPMPSELDGKGEWKTCFSHEALAALGAGDDVLRHPLVAAFEAVRGAAATAKTAVRAWFAHDLRDELPRRKARHNVVTHADLLRLLRAGLAAEAGLLVPQRALRRAIRARFAAALIDEFQDTDHVQWAIFRELFGDGDAWLYLIGDPKQAIYSFRGADVFAYLDARRHATAGELTLPTNWRSDGRLVAALGHVMGAPGSFAEEGIGYVHVGVPPHHEGDRLVFPGGPRPPFEVAFVLREGLEGSLTKATKQITKPAMLAASLEIVASEVVELLAGGAELRGDAGAVRSVRPGDIAVLVRTHREADAAQRALARRHVPSVVHSVGSVVETDEAWHLERLLDALARPASAAAVRSALATPLLGLTAERIAALSDEDLAAATDRFRAWGDVWRRKGVAVALRRLFVEERLPARLLARQGGERSLTNVRHLVDLLHGEETAAKLVPTALLEWLRARRDDADHPPEEAELRLERDDEAVTIATIHSAKGLEYPIVFCPTLYDGTVLRGRGGAKEVRHLRFHDRANGDRISLDLHADASQPPKREHVAQAERERHAENLRLLYVALTRARHRCVVTFGGVNECDTSPLSYVLLGDPTLAPAERLAALRAQYNGWGDEDLLAPLRALEAASDGAVEVGLRRLPVPSGGFVAGAPDGATLRRRIFRRVSLDPAWRRGSYSSLIQGATHGAAPRLDVPTGGDAEGAGSPDAEGFDYDAAPPEPQASTGDPLEPSGPGDAASEPRPAPVAPPLEGFPGGTGPGTALHKILELVDFTADGGPESLAAVAPAVLRRHGYDAHALGDLVAHGLRRALYTPLGGPLGARTLSTVPRSDRLDELRFDLPVAGGYDAVPGALTGAAIRDVFLAHRPPDDALGREDLDHLGALAGTPPLRGFLTGAIDLVFRAEVGGHPRYFIADYKSNRLGADAGAVAGPLDTYAAMRRQMTQHFYHLQYHLYALALHRYLTWRLGPAYEWSRDVGGVYYLFLRAMDGPSAAPDAAGRVPGVFFDRPGRPVVEALSTLLSNPAGGAP